MASRNSPTETCVIETARGLTIARTRITLYDIMDYVHQGWQAQRIAAWLNLSVEQVQSALAYIDSHGLQVESQYQDVLRQAEQNRVYWEQRNRARSDELEARGATADMAQIRARIRQRREQLGL